MWHKKNILEILIESFKETNYFLNNLNNNLKYCIEVFNTANMISVTLVAVTSAILLRVVYKQNISSRNVLGMYKSVFKQTTIDIGCEITTYLNGLVNILSSEDYMQLQPTDHSFSIHSWVNILINNNKCTQCRS